MKIVKQLDNSALKDATLIGHVYDRKGNRYSFYEDPVNGDEEPLWVLTPEGWIGVSDFWELPQPFELE